MLLATLLTVPLAFSPWHRSPRACYMPVLIVSAIAVCLAYILKLLVFRAPQEKDLRAELGDEVRWTFSVYSAVCMQSPPLVQQNH